MRRSACVVLLAVLPLSSMADENPSALNALQFLPKEDIKSLARIEARDGTPVPGRWYFLVHDPSAASGLKEYVVSAGELVASRGISQFAENLTEADVIGNRPLRIDSDVLAELANDYAAANNVAIDRINYQLLRNRAEIHPMWRLNCFDEGGQQLGTLVVSAARGKVVSHEGFLQVPKSEQRRQSELRFETDAEELVAVNQENEFEQEGRDEAEAPEPAFAASNSEPETETVRAVSGRKKKVASSANRSRNVNKKTASVSRRNSPRREARRTYVRIPEPVRVVRKASRPVGNFFRRLFSF